MTTTTAEASPRFLDDLAALAAALPPATQRALILCGPSRRGVDDVVAALPGVTAVVFDGAVVHVPEAVVAQARAVLADARADVVIAIGGGAAIGLGKALRLEHALPFVAVPTTFAGSEMTDIWGVTSQGDKRTGRDARVVPDVVVQLPALVATMSRPLLVQSLLNALAHPIAALGTASLEGATRVGALRCTRVLLDAAEQLLRFPDDRAALTAALGALRDAGGALRVGRMGSHHALAHRLGGRLGLPHAPLHAALLPQTVLALFADMPALADELERHAGSVDLPAQLWALLKRSGAPTSLRELGVERAVLEAAVADLAANLDTHVALDAFFGRPPSRHVRRVSWGGSPRAAVKGDPTTARVVVVAVHGRGGSADGIVAELGAALADLPDVAVVAPMAATGAWYDASYRRALSDDRARVEDARRTVLDVARAVRAQNPGATLWLAGFSQGACLALSTFKQEPGLFAGLFAPGGAPIQPDDTAWPSLRGARVWLSMAESDRWVDVAHLRDAAAAMKAAGADVDLQLRGGDGHGVTDLDRRALRGLVAPAPEGPHGFQAPHEVELLPGALPVAQNTPRRGPYGLYPELASLTGFVAPRAHNLRVWLYRVRPSAQHTPFVPVAHDGLRADFTGGAPAVNLAAWSPPPWVDGGRDFVDALTTLGGAGSAALRRGYAVHVWAANRDMIDRSFTNVDGDLLLVPQEGRLAIRTELGWLDAAPGTIVVIPRGLRFAVFLPDGRARGYVGEIFAGHFALPERGPVGSNGLADERHFVAPSPSFEDRLAPGTRVSVKIGGHLHEATQDHSPWDVVAWHGNGAPYAYDLMRFAPVTTARVDHADPSIYTVLTAPLDEPGAHALDLVVFPPRWDATEHTFRPPFFHRNVTTELNGIVRTPPSPGSPFAPGMCFLTPSHTAHGALARTVDAAIDATPEAADRPARIPEASLWFQFESALPFVPSGVSGEVAGRIAEWPARWGTVRTRFTPGRIEGPDLRSIVGATEPPARPRDS